MEDFESYQSYWDLFNVSRETKEKIFLFVDFFQKEQERHNLISRSSKDDFWIRHVFDSLQLQNFVSRETISGTDFGSGGGFPGIILSIARPEINFKFVEVRQKKSDFLKEMIKNLSLNAVVINERIQNITPWKEQVITARALAPLPKLIPLLYPFTKEHEHTHLILPKGKMVKEELLEMKKHWIADIRIKKSITSTEGNILLIQNLHPRKWKS